MLQVHECDVLYMCYFRLSNVWCNFIYMAFLYLALLLSSGYLYAKYSILPSIVNVIGEDLDQISGFTNLKYTSSVKFA